MSSTSIVRLDGAVEPDVSEPGADRLLSGTPELQVRNFFSDPTQQFFAGRWSATRGKWRVRYTENELCVMTSGRVVIESDERRAQYFRGGGCVRDPGGIFRHLGSARGLLEDLRHFRGARLMRRHAYQT